MIKIKVEGIEQLIANMGQAGGMVEPLLRTALNRSAIDIKETAKSEAPVAFGKLKGSIKHDVKKYEAMVWASEKYAPFVEYGTKPHFPPIAPLERWAQLKLGNSALAWAVAKKIARVGTEAQPFFFPAVRSNVGNIQRYFEEFSNQIIKIMGR